VATGSQSGYQRAAGSNHRIQHNLAALGKELNEFLGQGFWEFCRVAQRGFLSPGGIVDEPGLLEFQPGLWIQVVEFIFEGTLDHVDNS